MKGRRRFHRINMDADVKLDFSSDTHTCCRIKNLSLGGMFVAGCSPPQQAESCRINLLHTAKGTESRFQASARVVWGNDEGVGLQFTSMTHDSYLVLRTTLINNAEQPAIIMHELAKDCPFAIGCV